jgi:hypothetical protein
LLHVKSVTLGVERWIKLDKITHKDEIERAPAADESGWIWTSRGKNELRRIPYLSRLRNEVMSVMTKLATRDDHKVVFDKVLWLNDVVFSVRDPF